MANLPTSIKNLNTLLGEQLTEGGGGGSSDFSTATVTFNVVGNASATFEEVFAILGEAPDRYLRYSESITITRDSPHVATMPLVDGYATIGAVPTSGSAITVSESAEYGDGSITFTGDCTITIS